MLRPNFGWTQSGRWYDEPKNHPATSENIQILVNVNLILTLTEEPQRLKSILGFCEWYFCL